MSNTFSFDREKRKFISPAGEVLTGPQVTDTLNALWEATQYLVSLYPLLSGITRDIEVLYLGDTDDNHEEAVDEQGTAQEVVEGRPEDGDTDGNLPS